MRAALILALALSVRALPAANSHLRGPREDEAGAITRRARGSFRRARRTRTITATWTALSATRSRPPLPLPPTPHHPTTVRHSIPRLKRFSNIEASASKTLAHRRREALRSESLLDWTSLCVSTTTGPIVTRTKRCRSARPGSTVVQGCCGEQQARRADADNPQKQWTSTPSAPRWVAASGEW